MAYSQALDAVSMAQSKPLSMIDLDQSLEQIAKQPEVPVGSEIVLGDDQIPPVDHHILQLQQEADMHRVGLADIVDAEVQAMVSRQAYP